MGEISDHWSWWHRRSCRFSHGAGRKRCDVDRQRCAFGEYTAKGTDASDHVDENTKTIPVKASDMQHYKDRPDVILVCVKGYSLDGIYEFIRRIAKPQTIVIPILNIYGTGAKMQEKLLGMLVTDGCIYVSANIKEPGVILQHGKILRIFFGVRQKWQRKMPAVRADSERFP